VGGAGGKLLAQRMVVSGRVLLGGPRGAPLERSWVVLHRVTMGGGGAPIDSVRTDARGAFALTVARPDTAALYVVSAWYGGIAYFSQPVTVASAGAGLSPLLVFDTTSAGPAIGVARRLVTIAKRKKDGTRDVLELVELRNPGTRTRIAADTLRPTWAGAIPHDAIQFQVAQGDVSPQALALRGDSVMVFGPVPPGDPRQLSYAYVLPANVSSVAMPIDQPAAELDLLLEDTVAVVTASKLDTLGVEEIEHRRFARYRATALDSGTPVTIALPPRDRFRAESLVPVVVALAAVALGLGFVVALRRQTSDVRRQREADV